MEHFGTPVWNHCEHYKAKGHCSVCLVKEIDKYKKLYVKLQEELRVKLKEHETLTRWLLQAEKETSCCEIAMKLVELWNEKPNEKSQ